MPTIHNIEYKSERERARERSTGRSILETTLSFKVSSMLGYSEQREENLYHCLFVFNPKASLQYSVFS